MTRADALDLGRELFRRQAWSDAFDQLTAADAEAPLEPEDLELAALCAQLTGRDEALATYFERAHRDLMARGEVEAAARCAFWLGIALIHRGDMAQAGGWLGRAHRVLDEAGLDSVVQGYLLVPGGLQALYSGDPAAASAAFVKAVKIGDRFGDRQLVTMGRLGQGQSLIALGELREGVALLDETMVAVTAGELSPVIAGIAYCTVISACQEIFDVRRAQEWTTALTGWCEAQQGLVQFRGQCLVHRAELLQLHGAWPDALTEANRACDRIRPRQAAGDAYYQVGEVRRLRGEVQKAEEAYREAVNWGREAQPGLALLRLAQGQVQAAETAIRRVLDETRERGPRIRILAAYVEIMLAAGDVPAARAAAEELAGATAGYDVPLLRALSAQAMGAVLLAEGAPGEALAALRQAVAAWHDLDAPYQAARARVLVGKACRALGDEDAARFEVDGACRVFQQLGAAPDLARLTRPTRADGGLTAREVEVLRLVAAGKTNRAVAAELVLSEKTVARHVANIFTKLGVSTRSAATAYAYEHDLV
jgi:DNA-binding NarL/FixJ family response regulator